MKESTFYRIFSPQNHGNLVLVRFAWRKIIMMTM
jgi:hypothetical protein